MHVANGRLSALVVVVLHVRCRLDLAEHVRATALGATPMFAPVRLLVGAAALTLYRRLNSKLLPLGILAPRNIPYKEIK